MARREYDHDPAAPAPNSLVPAASAIVVRDDGAILLQRRRDNDRWSVPGGAMEIGESILDCLHREVREETGLDIDTQRLIGIYSNPGYVVVYGDGEARQQFSVCFLCNQTGGTLVVSDESTELAWRQPAELAGLDLSLGARRRLDDYLTSGPDPVID